MNASQPAYVLGSGDPEITRLDAQSASIDAATRLLLRAAGIAPGMRVLDLGTGLGHVARLLYELVGPQGRVTGIDNDAHMLEVAAARQQPATPALRYILGDVRRWRDAEPLDAVVGRLILFHLPNAAAVLAHHAAALRPGGLMVMLDFDLGSARAEPAVPLAEEAMRWVLAAFRQAGARPAIGTRLSLLLHEAGLEDVRSFGVQGYLAPHDPAGPALLAGVVRTLLPKIIAAGIATREQVDIETLAPRLAAALRTAGAMFLPPALAGAWGRRAAV